MPTKQVIVWRQDLSGVPLGKKMAQAAHSAHLFLTEQIRATVGNQVPEEDCPTEVPVVLSYHELNWILGNYRKVVAFVRTEDELNTLREAALKAGLKANLVTDDGLTVFAQKTVTCLSIGPDEEAAVDAITGEAGPLGKLRLL